MAVADRMAAAARDIVNRAGETPAALVVIGHGTGPSNDQLRSVLGLSHPGAVRLVDRLVADGLVERRRGHDKRAVALHLSARGHAVREKLLEERFAAIGSLLAPLTEAERQQLGNLLGKVLSAPKPGHGERRRLCRLCDKRACTDCPIPADCSISG